jgi:prostatic aicd phosphatase
MEKLYTNNGLSFYFSSSTVNYAAAVAYEVRQPASGGEPVIRFNFKNGTDDADFITYNFMNGSGDIPVSTFVKAFSVRTLHHKILSTHLTKVFFSVLVGFQPVAIQNTTSWCSVCANTQDRGCAALTTAAHAQGSSTSHQKISPVGAGFLGAGLTLVVVAAMLGVLMFLGVLAVGRKKRTRGIVRGSDVSGLTAWVVVS